MNQSNRNLFILSAVAFLLHVIVNATTAYGFFRDEFYYIACSEHLAFGYIDQPPLSILLLAISRFIFGGLSKAICNHNNYWLWGPRDYMGELVIILGGKLKDHQEHFTSVEIVETVQCEYCMPYENNVNVYVCRGLKMPLKDAWQSIKSFN